ncbi:hypothetical protein Tco_0880600 [Tanacetum coccineum]
MKTSNLYLKKVWDQNQAFVPKDSETEKERMKRPGFNLQQESAKKDEKSEASKQPSGRRRRKTLARKRARETQAEESTKKQKLEYDAEKEELRLWLKIVSDDDTEIDYEVLDMKDDVLTMRRLVMERFPDNNPQGYELILEKISSHQRNTRKDDELESELLHVLHHPSHQLLLSTLEETVATCPDLIAGAKAKTTTVTPCSDRETKGYVMESK